MYSLYGVGGTIGGSVSIGYTIGKPLYVGRSDTMSLKYSHPKPCSCGFTIGKQELQ